MRTIKFRGLRVNRREWVYSTESFVQTDEGICMGLYNEEKDVIPDTVGQFTGLVDKNGREIYEGDILSRKDGGASLIVEFRHGAFGYEYGLEFHAWAGNHNFTFNPFDTDVDFCIIGNIHDNPELLKRNNV